MPKLKAGVWTVLIVTYIQEQGGTGAGRPYHHVKGKKGAIIEVRESDLYAFNMYHNIKKYRIKRVFIRSARIIQFWGRHHYHKSKTSTLLTNPLPSP